MSWPTGKPCYDASVDPILAVGVEYDHAELSDDVKAAVRAVLWSAEGKARIGQLLEGVASTGFEQSRLDEILTSDEVEVDAWRVGEAIAFAFLSEHRACRFEWPLRGDIKNPEGSPTGAEIVGFHRDDEGLRFAFGEVKTSGEEKWAPSVIFGTDGLLAQLEQLRDDVPTTDALVLYLGHRALDSPWHEDYKAAASRYLKANREITVFGVLVRDVEPKSTDLDHTAKTLSPNTASPLLLELHALYFPKNSVGDLGQPDSLAA